MIAKIPFELSAHIARAFKPRASAPELLPVCRASS
jgi:hypothetical protein